jgi:FkbM family methyltransferase
MLCALAALFSPAAARPGIKTFSTAGLRVCELDILPAAGTSGLKKTRVKFYVPRGDEYIGNEICTHHTWDMHKASAMRQFVKPGSTVIDAGANLGAYDYAVQFSHWVGAGGRVLAMEPQPFIYGVLSANAVVAGVGNMQVYNTALGDAQRQTRMEQTILDGSSRGRAYGEAASDHGSKINFGGRTLGLRGEQVDMITLDSLRVGNVSFIKIDVQGSEDYVIWGARETIAREAPVILMEREDWLLRKMHGPEMTNELGLSHEVASFDAMIYLRSIGYVKVLRMGFDVFLAKTRAKPSVPSAGFAAERRGRKN